MQPLIRLNLTLLIFYAGQSLAASPSYPVVDGNAGYLQDARGNAVISTNGNCWHTGGWRPVLATVIGCDGVVAKTSAVSAPQIPAPQAPPPIAKAPAASSSNAAAKITSPSVRP